jgi:small-conductance mechanosensitive channel
MRPFARGSLLLAAATLVACSSPGLAQSVAPATGAQGGVEAPIDAAQVVIDGRPLFLLRGISAYPAARRAADVADRIRALARDPSFDPATLAVTDGERDSRIGSGTRPVVTITEPDAEIEGVDRRLLAQAYLPLIRQAITAYRTARTRQALLSSAGRAGLATVLAALAFLAIWRGRHGLRRWLERHYRERVRGVTIRSFEVMRAERIWAVLGSALLLVAAVALVAVVVLYTQYALSLFPWTRAAGSQIAGWVLGPLAVLGSGLVAAIPNLLFLAVLFVVTRYVLRFMRLFLGAVGRGAVTLPGFDPDLADPTFKLLRLAVIVFAVIVAYPYVPGSSSAAFKGVSLFIGVVFSLGSSSAISNIIAGYTMVYRRAFREGDRVKIGDVVGDVTRVRLQVTHLRTPKNEEVVVPNSTVLGSEVVNYTTLAKSAGLILYTTVGIGYETPWRQVEAMLLEAATRTPGLLREPKPFVLQTALGDFAVTYQINVYTDTPPAMTSLYSALHRNILDVFNEYGVQIMTPAYEGDPETPKLVPPDKWHLPPAAPPAETPSP